jgi:hypothetical protein
MARPALGPLPQAPNCTCHVSSGRDRLDDLSLRTDEDPHHLGQNPSRDCTLLLEGVDMQPNLSVEAGRVHGFDIHQGGEMFVDIASRLISVVDLVHDTLQLAGRQCVVPKIVIWRPQG